ncbi:MAG TPA: DM13 domain-containing protein [Chitinophagaceae bacterium]|nr:DM13 domain-containing protein [Chitinophagaceae bacterium]
MKKPVFILLLVIVTFAACIKQNTPTAPLDNRVDTLMASRLYSGEFGNGPYGSVSGGAKIYQKDGQHLLALENVTISNGPDLHVYLSQELQPLHFIDLGSLQSVSGYQVYPIEGNPDFRQFRYALIHCRKYNHLFGSALLH